jgi:Myb-like DNA-binding domain
MDRTTATVVRRATKKKGNLPLDSMPVSTVTTAVTDSHHQRVNPKPIDLPIPAALASASVVVVVGTTERSQHQRTGRWTMDEKTLFLYGLRKFGKGKWKKISAYLPNRYVHDL